LAVAAGCATITILRRDNPYRELDHKASILAEGIDEILTGKGIEHTINRVQSMLSLFFHHGPVASYEDALQSDRKTFIKFFSRMIDQGIYLAPSPFEAWFISAAHTDEDIERTLEGVKKSV
jgi:glutamate-1-semialdehyde 2,1-aminomutase